MAPVIRAGLEDAWPVTVVSTGQHEDDVLNPLESFLGVVPDIRLRVFTPRQTPTSVASAVANLLGPAVSSAKYDFVVTQGDTASCLGASLAAALSDVPLAHVEAGLRSHDRRNPFPEETTRRAIAQLANLHLAPTQRARGNLEREGVPGLDIVVTGNTVVDCLHEFQSQSVEQFEAAQLPLRQPGNYVLVTAHRRESIGSGEPGIAVAVATAAASWPTVDFLVSTHPNPVIQETWARYCGSHPNIILLPPLQYPVFIGAMAKARLIVSDSGGVQEEAPAFGRLVLVMRDTTERPEGLTAGVLKLVGTSAESIAEAINAELSAPAQIGEIRNPFGDGHASTRILAALGASYIEGPLPPDWDG